MTNIKDIGGFLAALCMSTAVFAQGLPPLPPLPGIASPPPVTQPPVQSEVAASPPPPASAATATQTQEPVAARTANSADPSSRPVARRPSSASILAQRPSFPTLPPLPGLPAIDSQQSALEQEVAEEIIAPEFGLFDPSKLPTPPSANTPQEQQATAPTPAPVAAPIQPPLNTNIEPIPALPSSTIPALANIQQATPEEVPSNESNIPDIPSFPALPTLPTDNAPPKVATIATAPSASPAAITEESADESDNFFSSLPPISLPDFFAQKEAEMNETPSFIPPPTATDTTEKEAAIAQANAEKAPKTETNSTTAALEAAPALAAPKKNGTTPPFIADTTPSDDELAIGSLHMPQLPQLPDFTEITEPEGFAPTPIAPTAPQTTTATNTQPPLYGDDLYDTLPSWAQPGNLPAMDDTTPLALPDDAPVSIDKAPTTPDRPTLAGLEKEEKKKAEAKKQSEKTVDWPRNFKTQRLPANIYRKEYSRDNQHLPKAKYNHEVEAHLFYSAVTNNLNGIRAILAMGVPLDIRNRYGETPLMAAVRYHALDSVRMLLGMGLNPNDANSNGATALHYATQLGRQDIAGLLLQAGAFVESPDAKGITPIQLAQWRHDHSMWRMLNQYRSYQQASTIPQYQFQPPQAQTPPIARYMR